MLAAAQIRMARAALNVSVRELSELTGVAESTIHRFETNRGGMQTGTLAKLQAVLEERGVLFIYPDTNGGAGVRLRH